MFNIKKHINKYPTNIKANIGMGIASAITLNLVNPYFAKFALRLGASDYHIANLSSLPALVGVLTLIPGAMLIDYAKNKQNITSKIMLAHKIFYLIIALVPFIAKQYQASIFVLLVGLMNFPFSVYNTGYQSSIGDLFKPENRGTAMSLRNKYSDMARLITVLITGNLLSYLSSSESKIIIVYQCLFVIAFFVSLFEIYFFKSFKFPLSNSKEKDKSNYFKTFISVIKQIPKNKQFIIFTICSLSFHFGWQMGWPLFNLYSIKYLFANELWLSFMSIVAGLSTIFMVKKWANLADKRGNSFTLYIVTALMAITPLLFVISHSLIQITIFHAIIGTATCGTILILFNILLEIVPDKNRTIYIAIYSTLINISATIAPLVGVYLKNRYSIQIALIIVACLRALGSFTFYLRNKFSNI